MNERSNVKYSQNELGVLEVKTVLMLLRCYLSVGGQQKFPDCLMDV